MESLTIVLILLLAVVVSGAVSRLLPVAIPRPLVQIALGAGIGLAGHWRVTLDPELFFLLFLPPLLFLDGWRIPKDEIRQDRWTILELALGLVIFTVLGVGLFVHWLIPALPLPVAFALAAVVSPTDPIAVSAIVERVPVPKRLMHILEGESLLNDASGLVCLRFAVAAALTATFSVFDAAVSFAWVAAAGLATGVVVTWAISRAKLAISSRVGEESGSQILISLLMPFAAYLAADQIGASGILAAVAAGVTMSFTESTGRALAATRVQRATVWDMVQFAANGTIFVLLGEQLPRIFADAPETVRITGHQSPWWLAVYVLAITLGLALLRFLWVWVSLRFTIFRVGGRDGAATRVDWRVIAAVSVAGVRGAVTLAAVVSLPLAMPDGSPFPGRNLSIALAAGVILLSLVAASAGLPLLFSRLTMPADGPRQVEEERVRAAAATAAMSALKHLGEGAEPQGVYAAAVERVLAVYNDRLARQANGTKVTPRAERDAERAVRISALQAERGEVFRQIREREVSSELGRKLVRELDLLEERYRA